MAALTHRDGGPVVLPGRRAASGGRRAPRQVFLVLILASVVAVGSVDADATPLVRTIGSGWDGFARARAVGPLPASLSFWPSSTLPAADWLGGGVDLTSSFRVGDRLVALPGPDVSSSLGRTSWAPTPAVPFEPADGSLPASDASRSLIDAYDVARSAVSMRGGDALEEWEGAFGRSLGDSAAVLELDGGTSRADAPSGLGRADLDRFSGRIEAVTDRGFIFRAEGTRADLVRREAYDGLVPEYVRSVRTGSSIGLAVDTGETRVLVAHGSAWFEDARGGVALREHREVTALSVRKRGGRLPIDAVELSVARLSSDGSLVGGGEDAWSSRVAATRSARFAGGDLDLEAGASRRRGTTLPSARVLWSLERGSRTLGIEARIVARHPTSSERLLVPLALPDESGEAKVQGHSGIGPEGAGAVFLSVTDATIASGAGLTLAAARLVDPITLSGDTFRPVNGPDETTGSAVFWLEAGERDGAGCRLDVAALVAGPESSLRATTPAASLSAALEVWLDASFFARDYLATRWSARVIHESGRGEGAWDGTVDDAVTTLNLSVEGRAGSAEAYVRLLDALDAAAETWPLKEPWGRRLEAGFRWGFRG